MSNLANGAYLRSDSLVFFGSSLGSNVITNMKLIIVVIKLILRQDLETQLAWTRIMIVRSSRRHFRLKL